MAKCPICEARLGTKNIIVGKLDRKVCPICGAKLRINKWHMFIILVITMMINFCINQIITQRFTIVYIATIILLDIIAIGVGGLIAGYIPVEEKLK
ncbi:hypothetical protein ACPWSR_05080 [Alloiococcus sp. CFN-8]|uniref:hypothetical protein n=1 Tax=Alloiococcus sp. CFN-8 TaxID=3416081 RepID=UPI003CE9F88C